MNVFHALRDIIQSLIVLLHFTLLYSASNFYVFKPLFSCDLFATTEDLTSTAYFLREKLLSSTSLEFISHTSSRCFPQHQVFHDIIHDVAMFIAKKEEKSMASQNLSNFPEHHDENFIRISFPDNDNGYLPTNLRCPKLESLIFEGNRYLKLKAFTNQCFREDLSYISR